MIRSVSLADMRRSSWSRDFGQFPNVNTSKIPAHTIFRPGTSLERLVANGHTGRSLLDVLDAPSPGGYQKISNHQPVAVGHALFCAHETEGLGQVAEPADQ